MRKKRDSEAASPRKTDRVADALLRRVVSGEIAPGDLLPREAELATEFGVNRTVIREAIKRLEVHRLVRPVRRRGTVALDPGESISPEVLRAMISPTQGRFDLNALGDFLELRAILDAQMCALATARHTETDLASLEQALERVHASVHDNESFDAARIAFGRMMARATHNRFFMLLTRWHALTAEQIDGPLRSIRPDNRAHADGLTGLLDRVRARDVDGARELVSVFHAWVTPRLMASAALASGASLEQVSEVMR